MKSFYQYLAESVKEYRYRVKTVVPMDEQFLSTLKKALFKYDVKSVSSVKKTPIQNAPLDFREVGAAEVSIIDIVTGMPASSYVLATELHAALQLSPKFLVVRGENEPIELETEQLLAAEDADKNAILDNANYEEAEQPTEIAYGDAYNKKFLNYLAQTRADGMEEVPAIEEIKKVAKFSWLSPDDKTIADDFNKDHDTVKPVHSNSVKKGKTVEPNKAAIHGNYDASVKRKG